MCPPLQPPPPPHQPLTRRLQSRGSSRLHPTGVALYPAPQSLPEQRRQPLSSWVPLLLLVGDALCPVRSSPSEAETNNTAEYTALLVGIRAAADHGVRRLRIEGDSMFFFEQVWGRFRTKNTRLLLPRNRTKSEHRRLQSYTLHLRPLSQLPSLIGTNVPQHSLHGNMVIGGGENECLTDPDDGEAIPQRQPRLHLRSLKDPEEDAAGSLMECISVTLASKIAFVQGWASGEHISPPCHNSFTKNFYRILPNMIALVSAHDRTISGDKVGLSRPVRRQQVLDVVTPSVSQSTPTTAIHTHINISPYSREHHLDEALDKLHDMELPTLRVVQLYVKCTECQ
ncbi:hypothetical protein P3T76_007531 [Phytophthora citrophthora]|uniref:RNase H type-1 domain-containing protein n=1 Tax=Phytophthora citrophthora TaxID=4793 RepID=A0AAD9GLP6_9STRA|nr:hypothetical protein P3T76_007531 [Phytophthora citrophthora]